MSRGAIGQELPAELEFKRLCDPPWPRRHDNQPRSQKQGLFNAVGNEEHNLAGLGPDPENQFLRGFPGKCVKRAERFVHPQHFRLGGQRSREADPLLHAARKFVDCPVGEFLQPDKRQESRCRFAPLCRRDTPELQSESHIVDDVQPGEERMLLKDNSPVHPGAEDRLIVENCYAIRRLDESCDQIQKSGLSATGSVQGDNKVSVIEGTFALRQGPDPFAILDRINDRGPPYR